MLLSTTSTLDGHRITKYLGLVSGEAILGANLFKDLFAGIRDLVGGRSATYERELQRARDIARLEEELSDLLTAAVEIRVRKRGRQGEQGEVTIAFAPQSLTM